MRFFNFVFPMAVLCLLTSNAMLWAAGSEGPAATAEDQKKLEAVKKMFESPYTEEDYYRTDRLLVTATGSQLPVHKAPSVASVITAEDIEKMGAATLGDVLETVPGIHVGPSHISGYRTNYHIRGIYTGVNQQVLLLINGIPINTVYANSRQIAFRMATGNISRVEVIRGPGSAVHGADAFAGTINVITKDVHEVEKVQAGFRAGSFETYEAWIQGGGTWRGWEVAASLDYAESEGDRDRVITADQQTILDNALGTSVSLAPGVMETSYQQLQANLSLRKDNLTFRQRYWANLDESGPYWLGVTNALSTGNDLDMESYLADLHYDNSKIAPYWELSAGLNFLYQRSDFKLVLFPPGAVLPIGTDGNINFAAPAGLVTFTDGVIGAPGRTEQSVATDIATIYTGFTDHRLRLGGGAKYFDFEAYSSDNFGPGILDGTEGIVDGSLTEQTGADIYVPDQTREICYLSVQDEWAFARRWDLIAGVRYDHYSDFGDTVNPRLALVWEARHDLTTKLLYGHAFRPPSFQELYSQNNPATQGNPNLDPETIETFELTFDFQPLSSLRTILNLFVYEAENLIELVPDDVGTGSTNQNARDQEGYGLELEVDWEATDTLRIKANGAVQESKDKDSKAEVANTPQLQFYFNPHWAFLPNWSLDAQVKWVGERERVGGDTRADIDDYTLVGLTLRRKNIGKYWDLAVAVRNLFDETVREPTGQAIAYDYPMPGSSLFAEVRFHY